VHLEAFEQKVRAWDGLPVFRLGIDDLDEDIGGGILPGEILTLVGGEGSMKTALALHAVETFIQEVGRKVLFLSLDMEAYRVNCRRLMPLMDLSELDVIQEMREDTPAYQEAKAKRREMDRGLFRIVDGEYTVNDIEKVIQFEAPAVVVLDYLTAVAGYNSELDAARGVTSALRRWKHEFGCAFLILNQMSDIAQANQRKGDVGTGRGLGGGSLRRLSDVVLELIVDRVAPEGNMVYLTDPRLICSVAKTRRGARGKHWKINYTGRTISFTGNAKRVRVKKRGAEESVFSDPESFTG
jgi:KaiC/GvpD/RAD55 family RecA-like ATPase